MLFLFRICPCEAQYQTLVSDTFSGNGENQYIDLSKILLWGHQTSIQSAFKTGLKSDKQGFSQQSLFPSDSSLKYGSGYSDPFSLKTCTAIDYRLPTLNRNQDTLVIEFDALWDSLIQIGEGGRMVVALLYDYPSNGISYGNVDSIQKTAPFGRPAYNIRILNRATEVSGGITAPGYFFYGGGNDPLGEFEKTGQWWLPGFIAQPGGFSPQTGSSYPIGATTKTIQLMASKNHWMHFRLKFSPEHMELWIRKTADPESNEQRLNRVLLPKTDQGIPFAVSRLNQFYNSSITGLPLYYRWFAQIEAVRFYFRSNNRSYLANPIVKWSGSVTDLQKNTLKTNTVFPNPNSSGEFWTDVEEVQSFQLYDFCGSKKVEGNFENGKIKTGKQAPGTYFLFLHQNNKSKPIRIPVIIN